MADGARCNGVIAGYHDDPDPGRLAVPIASGTSARAGSARPMRPVKYKPSKGEKSASAVSFLAQASTRRPWRPNSPIRLNHSFWLRHPRPCCLCWRRIFGRCEHGFGRALHCEKKSILAAMYCRHHVGGVIEGVFAYDRVRKQQACLSRPAARPARRSASSIGSPLSSVLPARVLPRCRAPQSAGGGVERLGFPLDLLAASEGAFAR